MRKQQSQLIHIQRFLFQLSLKFCVNVLYCCPILVNLRKVRSRRRKVSCIRIILHLKNHPLQILLYLLVICPSFKDLYTKYQNGETDLYSIYLILNVLSRVGLLDESFVHNFYEKFELKIMAEYDHCQKTEGAASGK